MKNIAIFLVVLIISIFFLHTAHIEIQPKSFLTVTLDKAYMIFSEIREYVAPVENMELLTDNGRLNNLSSLGDIQIFPKDHIWNVPIDTLPVDPQSAVYINSIGNSTHLRANFGEWGLPYNVVDNTQAMHMVRFIHPEVSDQVPYPIPDNPLMELEGSPETCADSGQDCHVLIVNKDTNYLYELFFAKRYPDGTWTAYSGAVYNLSGYRLRPPGWGAADAAGLAILPGLVKYDEVEAGAINHAIRFSLQKTNNSKVWPAIASTSDYIDGKNPPFGQRFRLKSSFDTSGYPYQSRIVLEALKKYGMILADNAVADIPIYGTPDPRWNEVDLSTLQTVNASDLEAVDVSSLMIDENSGQARITSIVSRAENATENT